MRRWLDPSDEELADEELAGEELAGEELRTLLLPHTPHVWALSPTSPDRSPPRADEEALLDADERRRADAFRRPADRALFVAAHVACRTILARYLGRPAAALRFSTGAQGKPALVDGGGLRFNLAHTDGLVLVAVAEGVEVGVDVERVSAAAVDDALLEVAMAADERAAVRAIGDEAQRRRAFFATWARREAVLKALGVGLSLPVDDLAVEVDPDTEARIVRGAAGYALVDLPVAEEWTAALAVEQLGAAPVPRLYRFSA